MKESTAQEILRRLDRIERTAVHFRKATATDDNPATVDIGGVSVPVSALANAPAETGDHVALLSAGKQILALGRMATKFGGIKIHTAVGTTSGPTTTSTASPMTVTLSEMSITADFGGNLTLILFSGLFSNSGAGNIVRVAPYDGSTEIGGTDGAHRRQFHAPAVNYQVNLMALTPYQPAAGSRTITMKWGVSAGTGTATGTKRQLVIVEFRTVE